MHSTVIEDAAFHLWEQLDTPTSLGLHLCGTHGDWGAAVTHKVQPEHFPCSTEYAKANLATTFISKNPFMKGFTDDDRKQKAKQTWLAGEASCYQANERLSPYLISPFQEGIPAEFLRGVRGHILRWLGHPPSDEEIHQGARHGPGTTFSSLVSSPTAADKYSDKLTLTSNAVWYLASLVGTFWGQQLAGHDGPRSSIDFVRGNRHTVVPKTASTDRNIAIEASGNVYFQLGLGRAVRKRLRNCGLDLNSAHMNHRKMAQEGSIHGHLATIDLSNASDTLCKNLVRVLLRDTLWLDRFEDLRSTHTNFDGKWMLLEKFSSMGNGYTFELETLVFLGICAECLTLMGIEVKVGQNLSVFGDDIIIPVECVKLVTIALEWLGFTINKAKSYSSGPLRESCGGDFFLGDPVRGVYVKSSLNKDLPGLFTAYNGLVRFERETGISLLSAKSFLLKLIPPRLHLGCSPRLGDRGLHDLPERFKWEHGIRWVRTVRFHRPKTVPWSFFDERVQLACRVTGVGSPAGIDTRGAISTVEMEWVSDS